MIVLAFSHVQAIYALEYPHATEDPPAHSETGMPKSFNVQKSRQGHGINDMQRIRLAGSVSRRVRSHDPPSGAAAPGRSRRGARANSHQDGVGETKAERSAFERGKAMWTRSVHFHAGRRQASTRRADRPDTRTRSAKCPELQKE